ncbi:MAG TPA: superoxide dismutase [Candidatus Nanoarchaeia archaeon]|nr:superoxide dismutase [Candidatus Nanoarchaeia archaeon]
MPYTLPKMPYAYNSLEPEIDEKTMIIHHTKHHQTYIDKLNKALEKYPELQEKPVEELIKNIENISEEIKTAVQNNGGGHLNHTFFWSVLKKGTSPAGKEILAEINKKFRNFENFKQEFSEKAANLFGSGWTWLVLKNNQLEIMNTSGHENPVQKGAVPLLVIDVWEHAYYLKYQNRRVEYIGNFFNIINWNKVNEIFVKNKK